MKETLATGILIVFALVFVLNRWTAYSRKKSGEDDDEMHWL